MLHFGLQSESRDRPRHQERYSGCLSQQGPCVSLHTGRHAQRKTSPVFAVLSSGGRGKQRALQYLQKSFIGDLSTVQIGYIEAVKGRSLLCRDTRQRNIDARAREAKKQIV